MSFPAPQNNTSLRKQLYDRLSKDGVSLPEFDKFDSSLNDPTTRKSLYERMTKDGFAVPDFNTFDSKLSADTTRNKWGTEYAKPLSAQEQESQRLDHIAGVTKEMDDILSAGNITQDPNAQARLAALQLESSKFSDADVQKAKFQSQILPERRAVSSELSGLSAAGVAPSVPTPPNEPAGASTFGERTLKAFKENPITQTLERIVTGVVTPILGERGLTGAAGAVQAIRNKIDVTSPTFNGELFAKSPTALLEDIGFETGKVIGKTGGAVIAMIPGMAAVNATLGAAEPVLKGIGENIGEKNAERELKARRDYGVMTEEQKRSFIEKKKQEGVGKVNTVMNWLVAAKFGIPMAAGVGASELTGIVTDDLLKDTKLSDEKKEVIRDLATNASFFAGMGLVHGAQKGLARIEAGATPAGFDIEPKVQTPELTDVTKEIGRAEQQQRVEKARAEAKPPEIPEEYKGKVDYQGVQMMGEKVGTFEFRITDPNSPAVNANVSIKPGEDVATRIRDKEEVYRKAAEEKQAEQAQRLEEAQKTPEVPPTTPEIVPQKPVQVQTEPSASPTAEEAPKTPPEAKVGDRIRYTDPKTEQLVEGEVASLRDNGEPYGVRVGEAVKAFPRGEKYQKLEVAQPEKKPSLQKGTTKYSKLPNEDGEAFRQALLGELSRVKKKAGSPKGMPEGAPSLEQIAGMTAAEKAQFEHMKLSREAVHAEYDRAVEGTPEEGAAQKAIWDAAAKEYVKENPGKTVDDYYAKIFGGIESGKPEADRALFQYVGENANLKEEVKQGLHFARYMEKEGKSKEAIRVSTGWFRNKYDNLWRYEIDDSNMRLNYSPRQLANSPMGKGIRLSDIISYPDLFKSYPQMKEVRIVPTNEFESNVSGAAQPLTGEIVLNANTLREMDSPTVLRRTLAHEIQHFIQFAEGFAKGGNLRQHLPENYDKIAEKMQDIQKQIDAFAKLKQPMSKENTAEMFKLSKQKFLLNRWLSDAGRFAATRYLHTAGEIEARDVEARLDLDETKRMQTPPLSSENISPEQATVLFGEGAGEKQQSVSNIRQRIEQSAEEAKRLKDELAPLTEKQSQLRREMDYADSKGLKEESARARQELKPVQKRIGEIQEALNKPLFEQDQNALFQKAEQKPNWYFSGLEKIVTDKMPNKASAEQIRGIIRDAKQDEIKWTGLDDFLKTKSHFTKEEVQDYLKENAVKVEEVVKGETINLKSKYAIPEVKRAVAEAGGTEGDLLLTLENDGDAFRALMKKFPELKKADGEEGRPHWAQIVAQDVYGGESKEVKFSSYVLPGAKEGTYRELLLKLPMKPFGGFTVRETEQKYVAIGTNGFPLAEVGKGVVGSLREATEYLDKHLRERRGATTDFRSGHFEEENIFAHIRFNERTDAQGKKTLFIEEIQSDWNQSLRKQRDELRKTLTDDKVFERIAYKMRREGKVEIKC